MEFLKSIERKWQEKWRNARIFEANPDNRPKFFITFPYPYVNAYPHLGSAYTVLRVDIFARYKRMKGFNVLFPQGWHATGGPIVTSALRVKERDPKILHTLKMMGIKDEDIPKFEEPIYWVKFFVRAWREDFQRYGLSIDWRREFFTTYLNPPYVKFIEWQYLRLREKGLVSKGKHPVVWCPKEQKVVGDHDRPDEYAGISPEKMIIIKFKGEDGLIYPCITFRPETVYGAVNIWVNPKGVYKIAEVDGEKWVVSPFIIDELRDQYHIVKITDEIKGEKLVGKIALNPVTKERVPVLPASFVDMKIGTGIVMSVPAHAPYDYIALKDLQKNPEYLKCYNLDSCIVKDIRPISLIKLEGYGEYPAITIVEKMGIKSQLEKEKLEKATKEIYTKEFHQGILKDLYGPFKGKKVCEAKEEIINYLVSLGIAIVHWSLPSEVYCRCGAKTHVKIVENQWFLKYSDPEWKDKAHKCVKRMKFIPEYIREYFDKQIDWYQDWACTHKGELGEPLPWDPEWVLESLSDSTIYMAYYTISKYLQHPEKYGINWEKITPELFDYVFYGKGDVKELSRKISISQELLEEMRKEFLYWYPVDIRISGKDLMPNHLVFFIMHHVALFPEYHWPRGIGINGWVMVNGKKMSKSLGNFITLRQALSWWGADATRFAEAYAGDAGIDDANFEKGMAVNAIDFLYDWYIFAIKNYGKGRDNRIYIDDWFESVLNRTILETEKEMEKTNFKTALTIGFFNLQNNFKWYLRRTGNDPNRDILKKFIEVQTLLLAPFTPHICEEIWEKIGKNGFISRANWPEADESKINKDIESMEEIIKSILEDSKEIMKVLKTVPSKMIMVLPDKWKYTLATDIKELLDKGLNLRQILKQVVGKDYGIDKKKIVSVTQRIVRDQKVLTRLVQYSLERQIIEESRDFLEKELQLSIEIKDENECTEKKAEYALPGKPAIIFK